MCGIVGVISLRDKSIQIQGLIEMLKKVAHRGPDDAGYLLFHTGLKHASKVSFYQAFSDQKFAHLSPLLPTIQAQESQKEINRHDWDIFMGHRRLAIIDKSPAGHQPMSDLSKNIWLSYNGEIYNFLEIKQELEHIGYQFFTKSDTEVIIYAYIAWGIECIKHFNGMFAFVLYDNFAKKVFFARDRYGIKPLYYAFDSHQNIIFSSENKAIIEYAKYLKKIDYEALLEYFTFQNIFTNKTFFADIKLLEAGHYIEIDLCKRDIQKHQYWDFCFHETLLLKDENEYKEELERLFKQAVKRQLIADVPVGAYLSGGIDSGGICAVASQLLPFLNTFTIGFDLTSAKGVELGFDERQISEYLSYLFQTEHYEMVLKSGDMERCLNAFTYHLEEPRVGQSYPNYYAAKLASRFVKVVLSGCGGDELFGGYPWRYHSSMQCKNFEEYIDQYYFLWQRLVPNAELKKLFAPIYDKVQHVWTKDIFRQVLQTRQIHAHSKEDYINNSLYFEAKTFLHGLLMVEDKLSMAHSLEVRVPFLDNELVDFAEKIPLSFKLSSLQDITINENNLKEKQALRFQKSNDGKKILRTMLEHFVPKDITQAVKKGFSSPDSSWFEGESMEFIKKKLFDKNAIIFEFLDYNTCTELIAQHLYGKQNKRLLIWSLLNFHEWCNLHLGEQYA